MTAWAESTDGLLYTVIVYDICSSSLKSFPKLSRGTPEPPLANNIEIGMVKKQINLIQVYGALPKREVAAESKLALELFKACDKVSKNCGTPYVTVPHVWDRVTGENGQTRKVYSCVPFVIPWS